MTDPTLIEALAGAQRDTDPREVLFHSAFYDLKPEERLAAADLARGMRRLEAALDPRGYSTTTHAVLARLGPREG